ncbi:nuclear transport factor 2 family protein [Variovorax sp. J2P1-59]|uniref:nuclear transport factor 2 family protein n=1 Tax=Variovorax flavidus TaxID=3053501 RepID=UPI002576A1C5|nr:nuclear transport factor 2 family protein [Variovorax sp. J2P1-59]MDM0078137.1 nuclear transport factor 2 family protein [Variovorax sp. J2P1-59]
MTRSEDLRAIEQLQRAYARLNDEAAWHQVAELFTEDATFIRPSDRERPIVGRAAILQSFLARSQGSDRQHLVANPEVELLDEHHARASCHSILLVRLGRRLGTVSMGGFMDRLTRTGDGWRFQSRAGFTFFDLVPYTTHERPDNEACNNFRSVAPPGHTSPPSSK